MSNPRTKAIKDVLDLFRFERIGWPQYRSIRDGLEYFESLEERDQALESVWHEFADVPMNPDTERMEEPFLDFPAGTPREDIWHWFDERHSKGVAYLLYGQEAGDVELKPLMLWKSDFAKERAWESVCEVLGVSKDSEEVELKCIKVVAK